MTIRYYPKFLWIIPKIEVDYQCVTLPFAMLLKVAFNLHALNMPPAFTLSQDQTLNKNIVFNDKKINLFELTISKSLLNG